MPIMHPGMFRKLLGICILSLMFVAPTVNAQPGPGGPGGPGAPGDPGGPDRPMRDRMGREAAPRFGFNLGRLILDPKIKEAVGLTEDQAKTIEDLNAKNEKELEPLDAKLRDTQRQMRDALEQDQPDRDVIMNHIEESGKLMTERRKTEVGAELEIRKVLSTEQREKLRAYLAEHRQEMRDTMREGMMGRGRRQEPTGQATPVPAKGEGKRKGKKGGKAQTETPTSTGTTE